MNCPACETPGAYVGFTSVECVNAKCRHYRRPDQLLIVPPETPAFIEDLKRERAGLAYPSCSIPIDMRPLRKHLTELERLKDQMGAQVRSRFGRAQGWRWMLKSVNVSFTRADAFYRPLDVPSIFEPRPELEVDARMVILSDCESCGPRDVMDDLRGSGRCGRGCRSSYMTERLKNVVYGTIVPADNVVVKQKKMGRPLMDPLGPKRKRGFKISPCTSAAIDELCRLDGCTQDHLITSGLALYAVKSQGLDFASRYFAAARV